MKASPTIHQHLYQLYPNIPKYANDPQQSQIIRTYDLMLKRYEGVYVRQPKYFIRSPASFSILGSSSPHVQMSVASICSIQNIIICINVNGHHQIRFNHYQNAVYGEKIFENQSMSWKYDEKNDEYTNLLLASLKTYSTIFNAHTLQGIDVLVFDDFVQDEHLHWRQSLCLGIVAALHAVYQGKSGVAMINEQFCKKFYNKISNLVHNVKCIEYPASNQYNHISIAHNQPNAQNRLIEFPKDMDIIIAHSMTPMPKKMIKGKRENLRACQIQIGVQIIKNQLGAINNISSLNQLKKYLNCNNSQLLQSIDQYIPNENLSAQKIEQMTQKSLIDILKSIPFANNVIDQNVIFKPYNRIKYYIQQQFLIQKLTTDNFLQSINASYRNGRQLLEIGSQQIDDMIKIIQDMARAWKIIGDGWGGYLLIICESSKSRQIVDELAREFYMSEKNRVLLSDDVDQYVKIVGRPANGLAVLDPSSEIWY